MLFCTIFTFRCFPGFFPGFLCMCSCLKGLSCGVTFSRRAQITSGLHAKHHINSPTARYPLTAESITMHSRVICGEVFHPTLHWLRLNTLCNHHHSPMNVSCACLPNPPKHAPPRPTPLSARRSHRNRLQSRQFERARAIPCAFLPPPAGPGLTDLTTGRSLPHPAGAILLP